MQISKALLIWESIKTFWDLQIVIILEAEEGYHDLPPFWWFIREFGEACSP